MIPAAVAVFVACYLMGGIPFGVIVGRLLRGIDIRDYGSGNIGASNVLRTLGPGPAALVLLLDALKGLAAVLLCQWIFHGVLDVGPGWPYWVVAGGLLSILGHSFSVFLRFQGGRGAATGLGVIIGLSWQVALVAFGIWVVLVALTRYISLGSMVAAASVPVQMVFWKSMRVPVAYQILAGLAAVVIVARHASNVRRLIAGTEARIGQRVSVGAECCGEQKEEGCCNGRQE